MLTNFSSMDDKAARAAQATAKAQEAANRAQQARAALAALDAEAASAAAEAQGVAVVGAAQFGFVKRKPMESSLHYVSYPAIGRQEETYSIDRDWEGKPTTPRTTPKDTYSVFVFDFSKGAVEFLTGIKAGNEPGNFSATADIPTEAQ